MLRLLQSCIATATLLSIMLTSINLQAYTFTNIADLTNPAPSGVFHYFYNPTLSGSTATFSGLFGDNSEDGLFSGAGDALTTITQSGDVPPTGGISTIYYYASSGASVAFSASYGSGAEGVFRKEGGVLTPIAVTGGTAPTGVYDGFGSVALSGAQVAFAGHYDDFEKTAVIRATGGPHTIIAKSGDPAPVGSFIGLFNVSISGSDVAFVASFDGDGEGVFRGSGSGVTTIAKTGDPAPSGVFEEFYGSASSGNAVAFAGQYLGGEGIFVGSGGALTTIAKTGDPAPSGVFTGGSTPAFSNGVVAFVGEYGVDEEGIFLGSGGSLATVVKTGDSLFGRTVVGLGLDNFGLDPGGTGNLAFSYTLDNGQEGIAVALALAGDFNNDGLVNGLDLPLWERGFGIASHAMFAQGDANSDRRVNGADFLVWQRRSQSTFASAASDSSLSSGGLAESATFASPVAEPSTYSLVLWAVVARTLAARRRLGRRIVQPISKSWFANGA